MKKTNGCGNTPPIKAGPCMIKNLDNSFLNYYLNDSLSELKVVDKDRNIIDIITSEDYINVVSSVKLGDGVGSQFVNGLYIEAEHKETRALISIEVGLIRKNKTNN